LKGNGKTNTPNNTRYRIISPLARLPISTCYLQADKTE